MKTITIELSGVPHSVNVMQRKFRNHHARHAYYKAWYRDVFIAARGKIPEKAWSRVRLTFIVSLPPKRFRDYDNLVGSFKPIVDGLRLANIISNDTWKVTGPWHVQQIADKSNPNGAMRIIIENMENGDGDGDGDGDENPYHAT